MNEMDIMMAEDRMAALEERTAEEIAQSINRIKAEVRETVLEGSIRIGQELRAAKSVVPYGEWGTWLEENVEYSTRTAQNLMRIADEYGRRRTEAMDSLSVTQAVLLLGLPADERAAFVEEHDMAQISTDELQEEIRQLREEKAKLQLSMDELLGRQQEAGSKELDELEARLEAAQEQLAAANERVRAAEDAVMEARTNADLDVREKQAADAARDKAEEAAAKARQEAAELRTKLATAQSDLKTMKLQKERTEELLTEERQKPAKVEYQTPPEVEAELAKLREAAGRSEDEVVLRTMYKGVTDAFTRLEEKLKLVRGKDAQLGQKMGTAFAAALRKMAEVIGQ